MKSVRTGLPSHSQDALNCVLTWARLQSGIGMYLQGSIAKGGVDDYSDIDILICLRNDLSICEASAKLLEHLARNYRILTEFSSSHIPGYSAHIIYLEVSDWIVKLDVSFQGDDIRIDDGAAMLVDLKNGEISQAQGKLIVSTDILPLFEKMCGWLWFTYSRIARGENFAAARSIDFTREAALLPVILDRLGLDQDGHRRIEFRLPEALLVSLRSTHPSSLDSVELFRALDALHKIIVHEAEHSGADTAAVVIRIERMWNLIEQRHRRLPPSTTSVPGQ